MADQSDVEHALVTLVSAGLYPYGVEAGSIPGPDCRIYRGWPNSAALDADLAAGRINVTVFPNAEPARITTRYGEHWVGEPSKPTLTVAVSGATVAFGGAADTGQIAGILANGDSFAYRTQPGDTPSLVAANLASLARARWFVQLSYNQLTLAGAAHVLGRVVTDASVRQEVRRQEQGFRITCWCPTPATRDATATSIDLALSGQRFLALPDGTRGRLTYAGTSVFDQSQNARLYRRDLNYTVEYPTVIAGTRPAMLFGNLVLNTASFTA